MQTRGHFAEPAGGFDGVIPISVSSGDTSHFDVLSHPGVGVPGCHAVFALELVGVGYGVLTPLESF